MLTFDQAVQKISDIIDVVSIATHALYDKVLGQGSRMLVYGLFGL